MSENKLISIITPSYNRAEMIGTAIESVLSQNYPNFEHIIIDANSTDNTIDVLAQYPHVKVIREPDSGMYDALNKGLKAAIGDYIGFLNTDDHYAPDIFNLIAEQFENAATDAVVGQAEIFRKDHIGKHVVIRQISPALPENLLGQVIFRVPIFNAWFFRRSIFEENGGFDTNYRIAGDRELLLRYIIADFSYRRINKVVYYYQQHANALTTTGGDSNYMSYAPEHLKLTKDYLDSRQTPGKIKPYLQKLRTRDTLNLSIYYLKIFRLGRAGYFAYQGIKYDKRWPLFFLSRVLRINGKSRELL